MENGTGGKYATICLLVCLSPVPIVMTSLRASWERRPETRSEGFGVRPSRALGSCTARRRRRRREREIEREREKERDREGFLPTGTVLQKKHIPDLAGLHYQNLYSHDDRVATQRAALKNHGGRFSNSWFVFGVHNILVAVLSQDSKMGHRFNNHHQSPVRGDGACTSG